MKGTFKKKAMAKAALLPAATLLLGLAAGTAMAYTAAHDNIVLKDPAGALITSMNGANNAYSSKATCFNPTAGCHGRTNTGVAAANTLEFTYTEIESHSYHAQNGANEFKGFNPFNPDATARAWDKNGNDLGQQPDAFRRGPSAQGKNWVQSAGHVGNW